MKMGITFGTTSNNVIRAEILAAILLSFPLFAFEFQHVLDKSHESILHSPMSNITSLKMGFFCGIPYEDCLCSVQSKKGGPMKDCLTDNYLLRCRIFTLVSFVIQICLLRDLSSFHGKYAGFLVYTLWITFVFIFVIITNGIYQNSCFHRNISGVLCVTDMLLFGGLAYDIVTSEDIDRASRANHYNNSNSQNVEEAEEQEQGQEGGDDPIFLARSTLIQ